MPSSTSLLLLLLTVQPIQPMLSALGQAQTRSQSKQPKPTSSRAMTDQALDSIIGRSLFTCHINPVWSDLDSYRPYFDGTNAKGDPIRDGALASYFRTNDELKILGAEIVPADDAEPKSSRAVGVSLFIENQRNKVKAGTVIDVSLSQVTPGRILAALTRGSNYRLHSIEDFFPDIGMSKDDVLCGLGGPDHTNTDALGGDQMVYLRGQIYVYISPRTGRVTNVQTSFR